MIKVKLYLTLFLHNGCSVKSGLKCQRKLAKMPEFTMRVHPDFITIWRRFDFLEYMLLNENV